MCLLWFILILVVEDVLKSLKLESKPPSPENMVGRQSAQLGDRQAIQAHHSLIISVRTRRPIGSWRSRVWCKQGHSFCNGRALGLPGLPVALQGPVGTTEEGPSTSPAPREPRTDPTCFLTMPGASRCVWLGVHTWEQSSCQNSDLFIKKSRVSHTGKSTWQVNIFSFFKKRQPTNFRIFLVQTDLGFTHCPIWEILHK